MSIGAFIISIGVLIMFVYYIYLCFAALARIDWEEELWRIEEEIKDNKKDN
jgi:hypothetical protein